MTSLCLMCLIILWRPAQSKWPTTPGDNFIKRGNIPPAKSRKTRVLHGVSIRSTEVFERETSSCNLQMIIIAFMTLSTNSIIAHGDVAGSLFLQRSSQYHVCRRYYGPLFPAVVSRRWLMSHLLGLVSIYRIGQLRVIDMYPTTPSGYPNPSYQTYVSTKS